MHTDTATSTSSYPHPPIARVRRRRRLQFQDTPTPEATNVSSDANSPDTAALFDSPVGAPMEAGGRNSSSESPDTAALFDSPVDETPNCKVDDSSSAKKSDTGDPQADGSDTAKHEKPMLTTSSEDDEGEYKVSDGSGESATDEEGANRINIDKIPVGCLDDEARASLMSGSAKEEEISPALKAMVAKVTTGARTRRPSSQRTKQRRKPTLLKQTVRMAEDYGAYVPVLTNGVLSA